MRFFFTALGISLLMACWDKQRPVSAPALDEKQLSALLSELRAENAADLGVSFYDFESGQEFSDNAHQVMHAASTMKVPVMIELYRKADQGLLSLEDSIEVKNSFSSLVDSSIFSIKDDSEMSLHGRIGQKASIRELIFLMITSSSNLATNLLIELVNPDEVNASMRMAGADDIQVRRGVEDLKAFQKGWNNRASAHDMMRIFKALVENAFGKPESSLEMQNILKQEKYKQGIAAGVPDSTATATKPGTVTGISHDCAIVYPDNRKPYILVIFTRKIASQERASQIISQISRNIYNSIHSNAL